MKTPKQRNCGAHLAQIRHQADFGRYRSDQRRIPNVPVTTTSVQRQINQSSKKHPLHVANGGQQSDFCRQRNGMAIIPNITARKRLQTDARTHTNSWYKS